MLSFQSEVLTKEVEATEVTLKSTTTEVKDVKSQLQSLEIELQSQLSMVRIVGTSYEQHVCGLS